jgi:hypothetical protein
MEVEAILVCSLSRYTDLQYLSVFGKDFYNPILEIYMHDIPSKLWHVIIQKGYILTRVRN